MAEITIVIHGGVLIDVQDLPEGWTYKLIDWDSMSECKACCSIRDNDDLMEVKGELVCKDGCDELVYCTSCRNTSEETNDNDAYGYCGENGDPFCINCWQGHVDSCKRCQEECEE